MKSRIEIREIIETIGLQEKEDKEQIEHLESLMDSEPNEELEKYGNVIHQHRDYLSGLEPHERSQVGYNLAEVLLNDELGVDDFEARGLGEMSSVHLTGNPHYDIPRSDLRYTHEPVDEDKDVRRALEASDWDGPGTGQEY